MTAAEDLAATREALIEATLEQVPFDGWTERALRMGARRAGIDWATARRAFPGGIDELLRAWSEAGDREMAARLAEEDLSALRFRERVARAVRIRLEQDADHRAALRLALSHGLLPSETPGAVAALYRTVDAIWRALGDASTDFSFYTKRATLAGVYAATLLYWLDDRSEGCAETWAFLDRRLADVMALPGRLKRLRGLFPDPARWRDAIAVSRSRSRPGSPPPRQPAAE